MANPPVVSHAEALRAALQRIVDWSECACEHDTADCCANCEDIDYHCPGCIAAKALAEAALAIPSPDLRAYVQHKKECAKVTRETSDGRIVRLDPWEADKQPCTCGLQELLGDPVSTDSGS